MKHIILTLFTLHFSLFTCLFASPVVQEVTVYPFAAAITHQADLVIEEYVPLDAKRPGKKWTFKNPNVSKRTVWSVTAEPNTVFNAWLDTEGNGKYDIGEPFGTSAGRDYPEIELSNISPITPRIDLVSQKSDRAKTAEQIKREIREKLEYDYRGASPDIYSNALKRLAWMDGNRIEPVSLDGDSFQGQRIRVVRWLVNGDPIYAAGAPERVVLDKEIKTDVRSCLTEADFLVGNENVFDLDWEDLYDEVIDNLSVYRYSGEVRSVSYLVVVGDGPADWDSFVSSNYAVRAIGPVITRKFGENRVNPTPMQPILKGNRVTLVWSIAAPEIEGYTAYRAKILSGGTEVHDTGLFRNPARWDDGSFHWTITNSLPPGTYNWKIAAYNSKFSNEQSSAYTNGVPFTVTGE